MGELAEHPTPDCILEHLDSLLTLLHNVLDSHFGNVGLKTLVHQFLLSYNLEALRLHLLGPEMVQTRTHQGTTPGE